ncbi:glycosyltransferase family A protein [Aliiglaciecola sp. 2_MG-2023]|uniref:glycosyltransferase family A protein n=1 Tax=unclassified Aliiglaciecola TaxID=2593648 RepID=UPI0026E2B6BB|nr:MULTISPECIES: glycosyltransferase family A protein [unclassified Aliiglaciecola]MDO6709125.1 glycosyltransferase family A protein [Aliiglaciecola sp. 2_MG-2023]MDO6750273.1 glycosyltransferase family A protein [Aliiglaciecola sp. 1_MG-2023]
MSNTLLFSVANDLFRKGKLNEAMQEYVQAKERYKESKELTDSLLFAIKQVAINASKQAFSLDFSSKKIFEHKNNPNNYVISDGIPNPVVSFTAISTRIERVAKTVESIAKQTLPAHSINLYVSPDPYLVDEGIPANHPELEKIAALGVNIYHTQNIGPYRKQYPVIHQLRNAGASELTPVVTIDDDVIYPETILEDLVTEMLTTDAVVAHRGRKIVLGANKIDNYSSFPIPDKTPNLLNMGTGKNGMVYKLKDFPEDKSLFVGPILAPTADDIWCKWATTLLKVPTLILEPNAAYDPSLDFAETAPTDKRGLFHTYNARGTNDIAIKNIESFFCSLGEGLFSICKSNNNV